MALNKALGGPIPIGIFPDASYRLSWVKIKAEEMPETWTANPYYHVYYKGLWIADLYRGRSGWIGLIWGKGSFIRKNVTEATLHIAGVVTSPGN